MGSDKHGGSPGSLHEGAPGVRPRGARSGGPLYQQVSRALRDEIVRGVYPVGSQLPTEEEVCARFSVSRYTVREALRRLRDEGLISSRQGAGTVVVPPRATGSGVLHTMSINDLVAFAEETRFAIDSTRVVAVDARLAARIGVASGGEWLAVQGVRYDRADVPVCEIEYYINRDFAAVARLLPRHNGPIFPLLEDLFAVSISEVHQEIAAVIVSTALAGQLRVDPGSAALEVRRTYKIADGRIAQITINVHPALRFRHSMTMRRMV